MRPTAQDVVQRNPRRRVEPVIQARGQLRTVARKGLAGIKRAAVNLVVAVSETTARQTQPEIRVRPEAVDESKLGVRIHRRHGQAQRQVRAQEIRLIVVIKCIAR